MTITFPATVNTTVSSSRTPAVTFSGWTPATDDAVVFFVRSGANPAVMTTPVDWINPLGGNTQVAVTSLTGAMLYRKVTSGEVSGVTLAYSITNLFDSSQTSIGIEAYVVRGADPSNIIDAFGTTSSDTTTTTHVLAGLTGTDLLASSAIVGAVAGGASNQYTTDPSGWTLIVRSGSSQASRGIWSRNSLSSTGVDVTATNVSIGAAARYVSITVAFGDPSGAPPAVNQSAFFAMF